MASKKWSRKRKMNKRGYRSTTYTRRTPTARLVKRVAYGICEKKYYEFPTVYNMHSGLDDNAVMTSGGWYIISLVNAIRVGTDVTQRIGRQIYIRYIQLSIDFTGDGDILANGAVCRYVVAHDKGCAGVQATAPVIWGNGAGNSTGSQGFSALRNTDNMRRFNILLDRQHNVTQLTQNAGVGTYTSRGIIQHYIPIFKKVNYDTDGATVISSPNLVKDDYLFMVAPSQANCCIARLYWRVCFNDA